MEIKIIIIGGLPESLINFRGNLIRSFIDEGHDVVAMAGSAKLEIIEEIQKLGCRFVSFPIERNKLNPFSDLKVLLVLYHLLKREKPAIVLSYTIKPIIWGGIATRISCEAHFYGLITGLGFAFQKGGFKRDLLTNLVKFLYRRALSSSNGVIFQNKDNLNEFIIQKIVEEKKTFLVNGSGVDLKFFKKVDFPSRTVFLLIARLLGEKGIREYAVAAKIIKSKYPEVIFQLVGPEDSSPDGINLNEVKKWQQEGIINYLGATTDVRPYIENCSVYVLPSYHEGMPRTVLEAMAMGRPILTTDVPGCRETVENGENGWLVEKANVEQLAERMVWFIENQDQWEIMGQNSHKMANEKFDVHKVNAEIMKIMGLSDEKIV
ncbi:glycosyltransferase family 1 protein [Photobacterium phosphoreum]|uniref:glycosyltransferase family 4 protein n=1 Tax=Photobacterium phosphoreum TaxID=659 RepID=UPI000D180405|nr:glycosyltransferase family 4 protein [Photobacterium phosphoreum]PSU75073.1 glycosyltransferase family 1 protein [Photobacterium phosphoreum]